FMAHWRLRPALAVVPNRTRCTGYQPVFSFLQELAPSIGSRLAPHASTKIPAPLWPAPPGPSTDAPGRLNPLVRSFPAPAPLHPQPPPAIPSLPPPSHADRAIVWKSPAIRTPF